MEDRTDAGYLRPSIVCVCIYYIRTICVSFVYMLLVWLFLRAHTTLWQIAAGLWAVVFLLLWLIYYPVKYFKHRYKLQDGVLYVTSGVVYTHYNALPCGLIQMVSVSRTPLQLLFGVADLNVFAAGSRVSVHSIPHSRAVLLASLLAPTPEEESRD